MAGMRGIAGGGTVFGVRSGREGVACLARFRSGRDRPGKDAAHFGPVGRVAKPDSAFGVDLSPPDPS
jgi:hypothetical protein